MPHILKAKLSKESTILVVDDFGTMRNIIIKILNQLGFEHILEADDGRSALPILETGKVDLVISDWNMKHVQGIELLKKIRSNPELAHIPVMMVTAEVKRDQVKEAIAAGVNGYIAKPFTPVDLRDKLIAMYDRINKQQKKPDSD